MALVLARIDDRFIHGQVVVGWCRRLRPDRIVLCHDRIAADPWQSRVYASSVPPRIAVSVLPRQRTAALLRDGSAGEDRLLLVETPADLVFLLDSGVALPEVNIGGMHERPGRRPLLPFCYLDARDTADLERLLSAGVLLYAQTVPGAPRVEIDRSQLDTVAS